MNTGLLNFIDDTYIKIYSETGSGLFIGSSGDSRSLIVSNESWQDYYTDFTGYDLSGFDNTSAGIILNINDSTKNNNQNRFNINYGVNQSENLANKYSKQLIKIRPQIPQNIGYLGLVSNDEAWATYDVSTGMIEGSLTPNNVFSYAVEFVVSGLLTNNNFYYTGDVDITTETGIAYIFNVQKNPVLYTENQSVLSTLSFNSIKDFCKELVGCESPDEPEPLEVCYSGEISDTTGFQVFLSGFSSLSNTVVINRPQTENILTVSNTGTEVKYSSTLYSGYILYNDWKSGDYIEWNLYGFDYINLYQTYHKGNFPPYLNTGFKLYYPNDFNSIDSLVDALNQRVLDFREYPVWYPYECLKDTPSGIFITGDLMSFSKNLGSTGTLPIDHVNNRIDFISLRSYPQLDKDGYLSYGISIFSPKRVVPRTVFSGWNYLIPDTIQLQGFNTTSQNWEILDVRDNLYENLFKIERTTKPMGSLEGIPQKPSEEEEALPEDEEDEEEEEGSNQGSCKDVLFTNQQRNINFNKNPLCPPTVSFKEIIVTAPKEECKEKFVDEKGNIIQKKSNAELCGENGEDGAGSGGDESDGDGSSGGAGGGDDEISAGDYYIVRTGWNFTMSNLDNNMGGEGVDFTQRYNKYKVSLANFASTPSPELVQKDSFFIKQINLYTLDQTGFTAHTAPSLCSIGADYTIDVSGIVPIEITGIWDYNILPEESGIYRFFKTPFAREIREDEKSIKFNKVFGEIISPSGTGFLSTSGYGIGNVYYENSDYYFYNPLTESVYFKETLSDIITGFGKISGQKIIIKQDVINKELLFGGRLANSTFKYHEIVSNGTLTSNIEDVEYIKYDVLGFYPITGNITGNTSNGKLNVDKNVVITGSPVEDVFAYYPEPTGFIFSNVLFNIDYNVLDNFNFISINDNTIIYNSDSSSYPAPAYFNSNETLISIINESSDVFLSTGGVIGSNIQLYSTLGGASGNINVTSNSTGVQIINILSGQDIYPRLYNIVTERTFTPTLEEFPELGGEFSFNRVIKDPIMTGELKDAILATGFYYSSLGSGNINGNISTFTGVRTFFDVWDIATGSPTRNYLSFLQNNFISGDSFYKNSLFGTSPINVNIRAFYQNYLNTSSQETPDVADLIIKDLNNPNYSQTGIVFRLNGIK